MAFCFTSRLITLSSRLSSASSSLLSSSCVSSPLHRSTRRWGTIATTLLATSSRMRLHTAPPAQVGDNLKEIPTPALIVDYESLLRNIQKLPTLIDTNAVRIRSHFKAHKCPTIAQLQLQHGKTFGFCFQKVSEAEALVEAYSEEGGLDLLITNEIVDPKKISKLCQLAKSKKVKPFSSHIRDANHQSDTHTALFLGEQYGRCGRRRECDRSVGI